MAVLAGAEDVHVLSICLVYRFFFSLTSLMLEMDGMAHGL